MIKNNILNFIRPEVLSYSIPEIENWLHTETKSITYKNQTRENAWCSVLQRPEEFAVFLDWLRQQNIKNLLEIGSYNGGTLLVMSLFLHDKLKLVHSCDMFNLGVNDPYENSSLTFNLGLIKNVLGLNVKYFKFPSDVYFLMCREKYDLIFIDGCHLYDFVKRDFYNAKNFLNIGGSLVFHDINPKADPQVADLWKEIKNSRCIEIIHEEAGLGIGIWKE